jgi:peptide-methionine (S)-S-oxide reductase
MKNIEEVFFAGGCLWGVQEFLRYVPGILETEAGRANGTSQTTANSYDGYSECVRTRFDSDVQSLTSLLPYFFEIINPYSLNKQGDDVGEKYRTGVYSENSNHLREARSYINARPDRTRIKVEVLPLSNFVSSDSEHQDRLLRCPDDYCHINETLLYKYKQL